MSAPTPCKSLKCTGLIAWLVNATTLRKTTPVDWDSLTNDEKEDYEHGEDIFFQPMSHHRMHHKTCAEPGLFSKAGKATGYTK